MAEQRIKELEDELAAAREQVTALQNEAAQKIAEASVHALAAQTPLPVTNFMSLPPELRDVIYDMCVAKGKILVRWNLTGKLIFDMRLNQYRSFGGVPLPEPPESQLLRVSKQVSKEALQRLLATNTFYGMPTHCDVPNFSDIWDIVNSDPNGIVPAARLSVAFDTRQYSLDGQLGLNLKFIHFDRQQHAKRSAAQWRMKRHQETVVLLLDDEDDWGKLISDLHATRCSDLEVNLQNCFCPCQCQSMIQQIAKRLAEYVDLQPDKIRFLGVSDPDVRRNIRGMFKARQAPTEPPIELSFAATLAGFDREDEALWYGVDDVVVDDPEGSKKRRKKKKKGSDAEAEVPPGGDG